MTQRKSTPFLIGKFPPLAIRLWTLAILWPIGLKKGDSDAMKALSRQPSQRARHAHAQRNPRLLRRKNRRGRFQFSFLLYLWRFPPRRDFTANLLPVLSMAKLRTSALKSMAHWSIFWVIQPARKSAPAKFRN